MDGARNALVHDDDAACRSGHESYRVVERSYE